MRRKHGYTLIEMLIVSGMFLTMFSLVFGAYYQLQKFFMEQERTATALRMTLEAGEAFRGASKKASLESNRLRLGSRIYVLPEGVAAEILSDGEARVLSVHSKHWKMRFVGEAER